MVYFETEEVCVRDLYKRLLLKIKKPFAVYFETEAVYVKDLYQRLLLKTKTFSQFILRQRKYVLKICKKTFIKD